jgi:PPK2 family polyphosphate:nucleotide phosphotransferase
MPLPAKFIERYRIDKPDRFRLAEFGTNDAAELNLDKDEVKELLEEDADQLGEMQERLYAEDKWAVLIVLQGMDTAGKDGVIEHVMAGVNPQGCIVHPFKAPSAEEIDHDFLWRSAMRLPERGRIGIFNRSHYEEVLVVRVHPELLARQKLPPNLTGNAIWKHRFKSIRGFERHLARNGTIILKFFLHISPEEQRQRLLARLDEPAKRWKFNAGDIAGRKLWDKYAAYEARSVPQSRPWALVRRACDSKPFARLVVARAIVDALSRLDLKYPQVGGGNSEMQKIRQLLEESPRSRQGAAPVLLHEGFSLLRRLALEQCECAGGENFRSSCHLLD